MLSSDTWSNHIFDSCQEDDDNGCVFIPFTVGKWLFVGCIIFSFLLLAYEARKARKIILSRDISYAFTNVMANNYYSLRSYDHFCFFSRINDSTKTIDDFAFFVFFTFKSWKRLLLADGPRQTINALTLYSFYLSQKDQPGSVWDLSRYTNGSIITGALIFSTATTVLIFAGSALLLIAAGVCYVPLLCHIRGNLKEYCCHKVDKRISEIVRRKKKERLAQTAKLARKEAAGDFSHLKKSKKGDLASNALPQPTLPNIKLDDEDLDDGTSVRTRVPGGTDYYYSDYKYAYATDYPPPMPAYTQQYAGYPPSVQSTDDPSYYYGDSKRESQTNLTGAAAPVAGQANNNSPAHMANPYGTDNNGDYAYGGQNAGYGHDGYGHDGYGHDGYAGYGQDVPGAYAVSGDPNEYGQYGQAYSNYGRGHEQDISQARSYTYDSQAQSHITNAPTRTYGQAYSNYGRGHEQDISQARSYTYDSQAQSHITNAPTRTASRAQNHQYDNSAYQQSRQGGSSGYDAYGHNGGSGNAIQNISSSMEDVDMGSNRGDVYPALLHNQASLRKKYADIVLFDRLSVHVASDVKRGDVVSLRSPINPKEYLVKRVVALEGDVVQTLPPYPVQEVKVPEGYVWVEGDEPFWTLDSNSWGPVPRALIDAKLTFILWPFDRFGRLKATATKVRDTRTPRTSSAGATPAWKRQLAEMEQEKWRNSRART
ncbi:hypothetical protein A7U60_g1174 [Sanghuangporus baumii]|uniref:Peptidase S26 domain-containing protein n=1 Tax=Sanghuangporus baumii TaxID=108892 RepID=A0A9Q5NBF8_SANBA|nr:hypothetical protein A7U60_g1174 [Sanghuangporus baumii]